MNSIRIVKVRQGISGPVGPPGPSIAPSGPFPNAVLARAAGVLPGSAYYDSSFGVKILGFPIGTDVALMGDSQTAQNCVGTSVFSGEGYAVQARALLGSRFDFVSAGSSFAFATGGYSTDQIIATHLPQVLASGAKLCLFMSGSNDAGLSGPGYAAKISSICTQLSAAGIFPVCLDCPPSPTGRDGNGSGAISAQIAARWAATPAAVIAAGGIHVPCPAALQTTPGSAVGVASYFRSDLIHINDDGAYEYGKALAAALAPLFSFTIDPYAMGGAWITANPQMAGSSGRPSSWDRLSFSSGSTAVESLVDLGGGNFAWQLDFTDGGSGAPSSLYYSGSQLGGDATGKLTDSILTLRILSGSLNVAQLLSSAQGPQTLIGRDLNDSGSTPRPVRYVAADGARVIRTPKAVVSSPLTYLAPIFTFRGTAKFQISLAGSRSFPA